MKTKEIDEAKIKAQSIIWCDNSLEEKETMMNNLLSTLRQSVLEEVREKIGEKFLPMDCEDDCDGGENNQGCGCHNDSFNSGLAVARNQVTSLINNLIEEK